MVAKGVKGYKLNYWTDEEDLIVTSNYGILTYEQIAMLLPNRDWFAVRSRAGRLNLTHTSNLGRKYCANKQFFAVPNLLNSYWAGFIAADGNVSSGHKKLSIKLHVKDANHLESFRDALEYTGKVHYYTKTAAIGVSCHEIVDDLAQNFNIFPRKSFTLQPPPLTDEAMIGAFITGIIDGDGSISTKKSISDYPSITIYGTKFILDWIQEYFDKWTPITKRKRSTVCFVSEHHLYSYRVGGTRAACIAKRLSQLDLPRMERKWGQLNRYIK